MEYAFISVIVPVYNGEEFIAKCLRNISNLNYPKDKYEVIVVDNYSTDRSLIFAEKENVTVVVELKKGSYAARNTGIRKALGDIIAFTDVDCQVNIDWLLVANRHFTDSEDQIVSGKVEFMEGESLSIWGIYDRNRFLKQALNFQRQGAATANLFVKRSVFEKVGLFDFELQSGGDSSWVSYACSQGCKLGYNDGIRVYHPVRNNFNDIAGKCYRVGYGKGQLAGKKNDSLYLFSPKHISPGLKTLQNLFGPCWFRLIYFAKMLFAIYLLNFIEYAGKVNGFRAVEKGSSCCSEAILARRIYK